MAMHRMIFRLHCRNQCEVNLSERIVYLASLLVNLSMQLQSYASKQVGSDRALHTWIAPTTGDPPLTLIVCTDAALASETQETANAEIVRCVCVCVTCKGELRCFPLSLTPYSRLEHGSEGVGYGSNLCSPRLPADTLAGSSVATNW